MTQTAPPLAPTGAERTTLLIVRVLTALALLGVVWMAAQGAARMASDAADRRAFLAACLGWPDADAGTCAWLWRHGAPRLEDRP